MQEVIIEIKLIEEHYVNARYLEAYQILRQLCCDNQHCEEFSQSAMSILSQYNDLENSITTISLELSQQELRKRQIGLACEKLIGQMKRRFNPQQPNSTYEEQTMRMKEHRYMLRKSLMTVEDDIGDCDNPKKTELLEQIKKQLEEMIEYFINLIKSFRAVKNYE